jgi:hypothetical protein
MNHDQRMELKDYLMGTDISLGDALRELGIHVADVSVIKAELADTIVQCGQCGYWVDVAIVEDQTCAACREDPQ